MDRSNFVSERVMSWNRPKAHKSINVAEKVDPDSKIG